MLDFTQLRARLCELNFGDVSPGSNFVRRLKLVNNGDFDVPYAAVVYPLQSDQKRKPLTQSAEKLRKIASLTETLSKMIAIDPTSGVIGSRSCLNVDVTFTPSTSLPATKSILLDGNLLAVIAVQNGPAFMFHLTGNSDPPPIKFSTGSIDFGYQFVEEMGFESVALPLGIKNDSQNKPFSISCASVSHAAFTHDFAPCVLEPGCEVFAKVMFTPSDCRLYRGKITFEVNGISMYVIEVAGKGAMPNFSVESGTLLMYLPSSLMDKKPARTHPELEHELKDKKSGSKCVFLGNLRSNQSTRRVVTVINNSPVALKLMELSLLPIAQEINKVHVDVGTHINHVSALTSNVSAIKLAPIVPLTMANNDKTAIRLKDAPYAYLAPFGGSSLIEVTFTPTNAIKSFTEQVLIGVANICAGELSGEVQPTRENCVLLPAFSVTGSCTAANVTLEDSVIYFGPIVEGNCLQKAVNVSNQGDMGTR